MKKMNDDTQLARWLAGEMDRHELESLKEDPKYNTYVRIQAHLAKLQAPQFDENAMLQNILSSEKTSRKVIPLYRNGWLQVAAMLVILLGLTLIFMMPKHSEAGYGETYAFTLPDQSEVILNAGSEASYKNWNWDSNREISLDGEAYFKVAKGKTFTVKTTLGTVTVVGTQFNVRVRGNRLDVVCYEGKVRVKSANETILLTPNQRVSFNNGLGIGQTPAKTNAPEWLNSELAFSQENLSGIISELERHYNVKIQSKAVTQQSFSGSLPGNDLEAALSILSITFHLKIAKTADKIILTPDAGA
jgi:transmembrane sensor